MGRRQQTDGSLALEQKKVFVIEAAQRPEAQKLRVAAYCRVSSDSSDQMNSFAAQLNYYTTLINSKDNWTMADIYADAGISGTSAEKRPDFQRLLSDCRRGRIDKILVKSISRFARNAVDCLKTIRALKAIGVGVCFEEQGIDTSEMTGELLTAMFSAIAQKESESISGNMRWSYQHRMKSGKFITCKAPFGYHLKDGMLEVYEPEAEIVRMIFDQYLAGQSKDEIAAHVTTLGIPTRDGKEYWQHSSISYILRNERYVGDALLQKRYTTDTLPYKKKMNHGEREQYYMPQSHPPIIDRETFNAVRELLDRRSITMPRHERDPLALNITCGACGTPFRRTVCSQKTYWVCRKHYKSMHNCSMEQIAEDEIHAAFLRIYHKLRLHGEPILKQMLSDLQSIRERRMLWSVDIIELNKRISDINDQDRMLADMNKCGLVDPDIFISRSNDLAHQLRTAKLEKERILGAECDDTIPRTRELMETLETLPEFLPAFNGEIFTDLVDGITADSGNILRFRLKNGLELTERVERSVR